VNKKLAEIEKEANFEDIFEGVQRVGWIYLACF